MEINAECKRRFKQSGTTATLVMVVGWEVIVASVGDSCAYMDTGTEIVQVRLCCMRAWIRVKADGGCGGGGGWMCGGCVVDVWWWWWRAGRQKWLGRGTAVRKMNTGLEIIQVKAAAQTGRNAQLEACYRLQSLQMRQARPLVVPNCVSYVLAYSRHHSCQY